MVSKIRLCHIITRLDVGGAAENTLRSACGLDPERYEVSLIYGRTDNPLQPWIDRAKAQGVQLYYLPDLVREIHPITDFRILFQLSKLLGKIRPQIVHTHSSKAGILGRWAARLRRVPLIVHTPHGHVFYGYYGALGSWFFRMIEKITGRFTHRMIGLTELEIQHHIQAGIGKPGQFIAIHSGVEIEKYASAHGNRDSLREQLRVPKEGFCIGSAGRLAPVKNFTLLLQALDTLHSKHPDRYHLVIFGEGAERGILLNQSMELGVQDRFYLPGWVDSMQDYYPAFDLFVLCSKNEGMGRVLVEAMAAGLPVIATSVGGVPELLGEGEYGVLVPSGDPEALAEAILRVTSSKELRLRLIEKGKERAKNYTADLMIEKLEILYEELLRKQGFDSMIVGIHQPQYLPWLGYFGKILMSDRFVILDTVQYVKNEWQNRNRLRTSSGWQWITVPVEYHFPQTLLETQN